MPSPPFRRLQPADFDRPVSASPNEITKDWIVRVIEHTPLDEIRQFPTAEVAREMPPLVEEMLRVALTPGKPADSGELERRVRGVVTLRDEAHGPAPGLPRDISALELVLIAALKRELADEPHRLVDAVERLACLFSSIQALVIEDLLSSRSNELEWLAHTDGLTGLFNLRYLHQQIAYLLGLQQRYGHPFALLLLDVDGLKRVNDSFGHAAGDQLLVGVAEAIRATTREVDVPARIGGDEFCVLAPHQTAARAALLAQRLGTAVEELQTGDGASVGVSIGVVSCPEHATEPERLFELADAAMYTAKAAGERVRLATPES